MEREKEGGRREKNLNRKRIKDFKLLRERERDRDCRRKKKVRGIGGNIYWENRRKNDKKERWLRWENIENFEEMKIETL